MEWLPLAHAELTEKFTPFMWKMVFMFMFTVEFMPWKMSPDPIMAESCFSAMMVADSTTAFAEESLPKMHPTSLLRR